jgi:hypothetical protein
MFIPRSISSTLLLVLCLASAAWAGRAESPPLPSPVVRVDFAAPQADLALHGGLKVVRQLDATALEFTAPLQHASMPFGKKLNGMEAASVAVWVYPRRSGEQNFVSRGSVVTDALGNRRFPPEKAYVNFMVGTDRNGFLAGAVHGNGQMPFPFVTLNEVAPNFWSHLVVTKDKEGFGRFYVNGVLVASDVESSWAPVARAFVDEKEDGPPVVLQMPQGGLMGEVAVYGAALSEAEVKRQFETGRERYRPVASVKPIRFREMTQKPDPELWNRGAAPHAGIGAESYDPDGTARLNGASWKWHRERIVANLPTILGVAPEEVLAYYKKRDAIKNGDFSSLAADLEARVIGEEDQAITSGGRFR